MGQLFLNSLINGLAIGVFGLAFTLVYRPTGVFHIAAGAIYALVPFVTLELGSRGMPWPFAVFLSIAIGTLTSCACEILNHSRLTRYGASPMVHLISSLGLYIIIVQLIALTWGTNPRAFRIEQDDVFRFSQIILTRAQLVNMITMLILVVVFGVWVSTTSAGIRFKGLTNNPSAMALLGYPVQTLRILAFGVSGLLISIVSLVTAFDLGFDSQGGMPATLLAVVAVIIGGRESFSGPIIGGILLGLLRSFSTWYFPKWQEAITFLLLGIFLIFLPNGFFSRATRLEGEV